MQFRISILHFLGSEPNYFEREKVVKEFDNVKFKCSSTGEPKPINAWRKIGPSYDEPIKQGQWHGNLHTILINS